MSSCVSRVVGPPSQWSPEERQFGIFALEHIRRMRGGTQSQLMRCSDGCCYVVKFQNNPQGNRVLANELLCARLAEQLGIPIARADVITVDPRLIELSEELRIELPFGRGSRVPCQSGRCFGSRFPGVPGNLTVIDFMGDRQLRACLNVQDFWGMLVFDIWTANTDNRQVLFVPHDGRVRYRAIMIDQSKCFGGRQWELGGKDRGRLYSSGAVYEDVRGIGDFELWLQPLETRIDRQCLTRAASEIPEEWIDGDTAGLNLLLDNLDERRTLVRKKIIALAESARQIFPNWRQNFDSVRCTWSRAG